MQNEFMNIAIEEAKKANASGEVPVGAVLVMDGKAVAKCHNLVEAKGVSTAHAELLAINEASEKLGLRSLSGASLYVTLEPCPMCAGAIINSRISSLYFGAYDPAFGAFGGKFDLSQEGISPNLKVYGGICEEECSSLLTEFFKNLRA